MTSLSPYLFVRPNPTGTLTGLLPIMLPVFLGFLAVSAPMVALSIEVGGRLGFGGATVGWVIGLQPLATLLTRHQAGTLCDRRGSRLAVLIGLSITASAGLLLALSSLMPAAAGMTVAVLIAGHLVSGLGESLVLTGLMSWGMARLRSARTGQVMSWTGIAIYAALGVGAPLGLAVRSAIGFGGVGLVVLAAPALARLIVLTLTPVPASGGQRVPFHRVIGLIWRPGLILALATVPFATMAAFLVLDFAAHGWADAGMAFFGFGAAYVLVRLMASGLPDRIGASRLAVGSLAFEALGQGPVWCAPVPAVALVGSTLTGLVFPAMGVLATRSVPPEQRGRAVGNFTAFADIALAVTGPGMGFVTQWCGIGAAFLVGAGATILALCLLPTIRLARTA